MVKFRPYCLVEGGSMHRGCHNYWECRLLTPRAEGREGSPCVTSRGAHDFPTEQTVLVKYSWLVARIVMPRCASASLLWASCHAAACGFDHGLLYAARGTICHATLFGGPAVFCACHALCTVLVLCAVWPAVCDWWIYMSRHPVWLSVCAGSEKWPISTLF